MTWNKFYTPFTPNRISANRPKFGAEAWSRLSIRHHGLNELRGAIELMGVTHEYVQSPPAIICIIKPIAQPNMNQYGPRDARILAKHNNADRCKWIIAPARNVPTAL